MKKELQDVVVRRPARHNHFKTKKPSESKNLVEAQRTIVTGSINEMHNNRNGFEENYDILRTIEVRVGRGNELRESTEIHGETLRTGSSTTKNLC